MTEKCASTGCRLLVRWSANAELVFGAGGLRDAGARIWMQSGARRARWSAGERFWKAERKEVAMVRSWVSVGDMAATMW